MKSKKYVLHVIGERYKISDLRVVIVARRDIEKSNCKIEMMPNERIIGEYNEITSFSKIILLAKLEHEK